ncbi:nitrilase-related carbon-nitrogen hydrolase [Streptomyces violarus]|uniref:nitrilase-related carbon-nitrogen hydrolase n=1 Tax=Streptomyces violarus TaxID=67380 RepID=UPI0028F74140|nr:nitrilase-related carbon-nitrogen hydrolase [Streptomyces violarus]
MRTGGIRVNDGWGRDAERVDGPTAEAMSAAAGAAGVWLHAGSIVERDGDGTLCDTALLFDRAGDLRGRYRKIHRYGFGTGEAVDLGDRSGRGRHRGGDGDSGSRHGRGRPIRSELPVLRDRVLAVGAVGGR